MNNKILFAVMIFWVNVYSKVDILNGFTFGPTFNWSFGTKTHYNSLGFNAYYWDYRDEVPWSLGIGYERGSDDQNIFFSEAQTGSVVIGASSGILYSDKKGIGFQSSVWGNIFAGTNLRYRYLGENIFCPGLYISFPNVKTEGSFE